MIPKLSERDRQILRQHLAQELDIARDANAATIRDAALSRVGTEVGQKFALDSFHALRTLQKSGGKACRCVMSTCGSDSLAGANDAIDEFCAQFFQLPPDQRRSRWHKLLSSLDVGSPQRLRVQQLEPGLDISIHALGSETPEVQALASALMTLFCLAVPQRAFRRQMMLRDAQFVKRRKSTFAKLEEWHPQLAALNELNGIKLKPAQPATGARAAARSTLAVLQAPLHAGDLERTVQPGSSSITKRATAIAAIVLFGMGILMGIINPGERNKNTPQKVRRISYSSFPSRPASTPAPPVQNPNMDQRVPSAPGVNAQPPDAMSAVREAERAARLNNQNSQVPQRDVRSQNLPHQTPRNNVDNPNPNFGSRPSFGGGAPSAPRPGGAPSFPGPP